MNFEIGNRVNDFRVTAYIRGGYVHTQESLYPEDFDIITDAILFECASFNGNGDVIYDENKLETALSNIRNAIGYKDVRLISTFLDRGRIHSRSCGQ